MNRIIRNLLIVLPWLFIIYLFLKFSINLPFKDDYRVFISFFKFYLNAHTLSSKIETIKIPDNESTPFIMRLISIGQYHLNGHINFKNILIFCWLFLVSIHFIISKAYSDNDFFKASVGFLVLNPVHHEMIYRTDVATYQLATIAMSVFMIYTAYNYRVTKVWIKAMFLIVFLINPGGSINGMLASMLAVYIFYQQKNKPLFYLTGIVLAFQLVYIFGFKTDSKSIGLTENIIKYNWKLVVAYFMSLGGLFHIRNSDEFKVLATLVGLLIWLIGTKIFVWKNPKHWDFKTMIFLFCSLSLAAIVALRYNYWMVGFDSVLESRYKLYGAINLALIIGLAFEQIKTLIPKVLIFGLILILFFAGFYKADFLLKEQKLTQLTDAWNVNQNVIEETFARDQYTNASTVSLLNKHKAFDFNSLSEAFRKSLAKADILPITSYEIKPSDADLSKNADWIHLRFPLKKLTVYGQFNYYEAYIIKFERPDGKSALFYLFGKSRTLSEKLNGEKNTISQLNHDFYYDFIDGLNESKITLYGLKDLSM